MNATAIIRQRSRERVNVPSKVKVRSRILPMVVQATVVFFVVFILGNFVLSLAGHILAEGQRAQVKAMSKPLMAARDQDRQMKTLASSEKSQESIEEWADQRGYVRKYSPVVQIEDTYVAQK